MSQHWRDSQQDRDVAAMSAGRKAAIELREQRILKLAEEGLSSASIAERLGMSASRVSEIRKRMNREARAASAEAKT